MENVLSYKPNYCCVLRTNERKINMSKLFSRWWLKIEIFRNLWMQIILYPKKKSYFFYFSPKFINHISILFAGTYISVIWDRSNNLPPNETNEWKLYESNETVFSTLFHLSNMNRGYPQMFWWLSRQKPSPYTRFMAQA